MFRRGLQRNAVLPDGDVAAVVELRLGLGSPLATEHTSARRRWAAAEARLAGVTLGNTGSASVALKPILSDPGIFGVDLYAVGLGQRVEELFVQMSAAPGAVRTALRLYPQQ